MLDVWAEDAQSEIDRLTRELADARNTLQFVERWANHHGVNPRTTPVEALSVIQHHPAILEITDSYVDGKRPTTRNPYAELAEAKARAVPDGYIAVDREKLERIADAIFSKRHNAQENGDAYDVGYFGKMLEDLEAMLSARPEFPKESGYE